MVLDGRNWIMDVGCSPCCFCLFRWERRCCKQHRCPSCCVHCSYPYGYCSVRSHQV